MLLCWFVSAAAMSLSLTEQEVVRLVNGSSRCAGRVEVFYSGQWGTVCDDGWDSRAGQVICRQLDCGVVLSAPGNALFGQGSGPIWLDDVNCKGNENRLSDCPAKPWGRHDCRFHTEDASAVCSEELPKPSISTSAQAEDSQSLLCKVPKLYVDTMVFFYKEVPRNQVAVLTVSGQSDTVIYSAKESGEYTCRYEVQVNKTGQTFQSPHSEPVLALGLITSSAPTTGSAISTSGTEPLAVITIAAVVVATVAALSLLVAGLVFYLIRRRRNRSPPPKKDAQTGKDNEYEELGNYRHGDKLPSDTKVDSPINETSDQGYANTLVAHQDPTHYESIQTFNLNPCREETLQDEGFSQYPEVSGEEAKPDGGLYMYPDSVLEEAEPGEDQYENITTVRAEAQADGSHYEVLCQVTLEDALYKSLTL